MGRGIGRGGVEVEGGRVAFQGDWRGLESEGGRGEESFCLGETLALYSQDLPPSQHYRIGLF